MPLYEGSKVKYTDDQKKHKHTFHICQKNILLTAKTLTDGTEVDSLENLHTITS